MVIWSEPFGRILLGRHILLSLLIQVVSHMCVLLIFNITELSFPGVFLALGDISFANRLIILLLGLLIIGCEEVFWVGLRSHDCKGRHLLSLSLWSIGWSLGLLHLNFALRLRWNALGGWLLFDHLRHRLRLRFGCHELH